jgi:integrase/recombinase XerD
MEVSDALVDYLADIRHLATKTQVVYRQKLLVFARWCSAAGVQLQQVNNRKVQEFLAWLKANHTSHNTGVNEISTRTANNYVTNIRTLLHWCLDDEEYSQYVKIQTVKGVKMPREEKFVKQVFTDEEIEALFNAARHESKTHDYQLRDTAILALLLDCGLRAEELRTLTIGNVALARNAGEDSYIKVMGKGRKEREIPLGDRTRRALNRYMRVVRKGAASSEPVFLSRHGGILAHETLKDVLLRLKDVSTLARDVGCNPHKFRHTFAARYMANGGDVYDLSRLMGRSSVAITEGYLKSLSAKSVRTRKKHLSVLDHL